MKTTPSRSLKVKNLQRLLNALFLNVILKTFQMKTKNQVIIVAQRKAKNNVMTLAKRKILKVIQMKVKNLQILLIAMIQNVMMLNVSTQVKKKI
jgi:hypothetical protein